MRVPLGDQIACVKRELALRQAVYQKRVGAGRMTQEQADLEISRMKAVLRTLEDCLQLRRAELLRVNELGGKGARGD